MANKFTKDDIIENKKKAVKSVNKLLESYINDINDAHKKKAHLLSYWLQEYVEYIFKEEAFDSRNMISYRRGDIVKLNFGFNVGNEYGGLHYGVVINNHVPVSATVLTVVPLTSYKTGSTVHKDNVFLGNELYINIKAKHDAISKAFENDKNYASEFISLSNEFVDLLVSTVNQKEGEPFFKEDSSETLSKLSEIAEKLDNMREVNESTLEGIKKQQDLLSKINGEILRMKEGSIALINQITTVSKMRIYDPRNTGGVLHGIRLSNNALDKITEKINELFMNSRISD